MTEEIKKMNIFQRMHAVMEEIPYIQKDQNRQVNFKETRYTYVSHDQVVAAIRPLLIKYRITALSSSMKAQQDGNRTIVELIVDFTNIDNPEDRVSVPALGAGIDPGDKGPGKAVSYAIKYAYLKAFNIETGDDPDHDQNVSYEPPKAKFSDADIEQLAQKFAKGNVEKFREYLRETATKSKIDINELISRMLSKPDKIEDHFNTFLSKSSKAA